jgi:hypothetical protein
MKHLTRLVNSLSRLSKSADSFDPMASAIGSDAWTAIKAAIEQIGTLAEAAFDEGIELDDEVRRLAENYDTLLERLREIERRPVIGEELRRLRCLDELPWLSD